MILQVKYSLWKKITILTALAVVGLAITWIFFSVRASFYAKDINQKVLEINKVDQKLTNLKNNPEYKRYMMMEVLDKKVSHINYAVLYEYLNKLKDKLLLNFRQITVNRFDLEVQPGKVIIKTATPNYNVIYKSGGMIDSLSKQVFVRNLNISEFRSINSVINFTITLDTK